MGCNRALAVLRIGLGIEFFFWAAAKTSDGWLVDGSALAGQLYGFLPHAEGAYATFMEVVVLPNIDLFAKLVTLGEWTAAITLTLGLFTRVGALTGMWLMLNFMLMRGMFDVAGSIDRLFFLACFLCLVTTAGRVWGLDALRLGRTRIANTWANPATVTAGMRTPVTPPIAAVAPADRVAILTQRLSHSAASGAR
jgi:uncharacterized membrane protein YphA (DoxX/SURF4 family)